MAEQSKIQWCDSTLNFWEGCTKVSAGCQNCYAEARDKRFTGGKLWGKGAPRRKSKSAVKDALSFNRKPFICDECGTARGGDIQDPSELYCSNCDANTPHHRRRIFSLSLGDWLDEEVSIEWLAEMLDTIRQCDQVTWILCTKRPENWRGRIFEAQRQCYSNCHEKVCGFDEKSPLTHWEETSAWLEKWLNGTTPPSNIILLTSVENQPEADKRIPELLKIPAACRGLSLEPLLGPVNVQAALNKMPFMLGNNDAGLHWLIIGGESGTNARQCNVDWIRSLVQQGKNAGVATFVKQIGSEPTYGNDTPIPEKLSDKKGSNPAEWPDDLRVQEWPEPKT